MHATPAAAHRRIRLRHNEFSDAVDARGLASNAAIAREFGVDRTTVGRVRRDLITPGTQFIAASLAALQLPFEALFEITTEKGGA